MAVLVTAYATLQCRDGTRQGAWLTCDMPDSLEIRPTSLFHPTVENADAFFNWISPLPKLGFMKIRSLSPRDEARLAR